MARVRIDVTVEKGLKEQVKQLVHSTPRYKTITHFVEVACHNLIDKEQRLASGLTAILIGLALLVVLFLTTSVGTATGLSVRQAFAPLSSVDIGAFYNTYHLLIDFIIYAIIFIGLSKATLGRHYKGRGGELVVVGVGVALSLSLTATAHLFSFSIKSFGPIAAVLIIFLISIVVFQIVYQFGLGVAGAASITYILMYFSFRALSPQVYDFITANFPFVDILLIIAFGIAVWNGISSFRSGSSVGAYRESLVSGLKNLTYRTGLKQKSIGDELVRAKGMLSSHSEPEVLKKLKKIVPKEFSQEVMLGKIGELRSKLEKVDISKRKVGKLALEKRFEKLEKEAKTNLKAFHAALQMAQECLKAGEKEKADKWLERTIAVENKIRRLVVAMQDIDKELSKDV